MIKTFIICAGKSERYGKSYPKNLELILGEPIYKRTIRLLNENQINDISITVSEENANYFDYENKIIGSNEREIDRFRNVRNYFEEALILYGDVIYHELDIKIILSNLNDEIKFFGRFPDLRYSPKKPFDEIYGVYISNKNKFFTAVDTVASNFENKIHNREIGLDVFNQLQIEKSDLITLSEYTDDIDIVENYNEIKDLYERGFNSC